MELGREEEEEEEEERPLEAVGNIFGYSLLFSTPLARSTIMSSFFCCDLI